jgi:hypothetical protein
MALKQITTEGAHGIRLAARLTIGDRKRPVFPLRRRAEIRKESIGRPAPLGAELPILPLLNGLPLE